MVEEGMGLAEPPDAALAGENVPNENDESDLYEPMVDELVGLMKTKPAYREMSEYELRKRAAERIKRLQED